jgi:hypothetical protein
LKYFVKMVEIPLAVSVTSSSLAMVKKRRGLELSEERGMGAPVLVVKVKVTTGRGGGPGRTEASVIVKKMP